MIRQISNGGYKCFLIKSQLKFTSLLKVMKKVSLILWVSMSVGRVIHCIINFTNWPTFHQCLSSQNCDLHLEVKDRVEMQLVYSIFSLITYFIQILKIHSSGQLCQVEEIMCLCVSEGKYGIHLSKAG